MKRESWPRLLARLALALSACAAAVGGFVLCFALLPRSLGLAVWDEIFPWPTDRLDAITVYVGGAAFLLVAISIKLLPKAN
jgi:hypothetical protein